MYGVKPRKVALIGGGSVGTSFLYAAMNRGLADEYGIMDINYDLALGNKMDLEDASATYDVSWNTYALKSYKELKDYDVLVITAGRPTKADETRLDAMKDNAKIMKDIALNVKKSGFKGVTIIASNPVDIMTQVYQEVTQFNPCHVIGSGTSLDTARLKVELAEKIHVSPQSINAYVIGEHGDTSVSVFSSASVAGKPLSWFLKKNKIKSPDLNEIHTDIFKKAYKIIEKKRATYYGVGSALADLTQAILRNTHKVYACGAKLNGEYGVKGIYMGTPAIIGSGGIKQIIELDLDDVEKVQLDFSIKTLKGAWRHAKKVIK